MKKLSSTMIASLTTLLVIALISCTSCKKDPITPAPQPTSYTISFNANGGTGTVASQTANSGAVITLPTAVNLAYTNYNFVSWNTKADGTGTSYTAGSSYTVTGNVTLYATWTLIYAVFTATDASTSALLKSLPGNSATEGLIVNVTSGGFVKLDMFGSLTNGNLAIGYWWITDRDSSELFQSTSTLNPKFVKIAAAATQNINLAVGKYIICFKTAPFSGAIANGTPVGVKITGANNNIVSTSSYTADATSPNATNVVKIYAIQANGAKASANLQTTGFPGGIMQIIPYSDEAGTMYDGNLYPSISSLSFNTKDTRWIGSTIGYSGLDFTNASGSAGKNFAVGQSGSATPVFQNSDAAFSGGVLQFSNPSGSKLVKSVGGNFSNCSVGANVYNPTSTQFGPTSLCWYLKSIRFIGNPEVWIYAPDGTRIW